MREFTCNSRQLADFLKQNGSKFLRTEKQNGLFVYVFEHDETIENNLDEWAAVYNKCMF